MKRILKIVLILFIVNLIVTGCHKNSTPDSAQYSADRREETDANSYPPDFATPPDDLLQGDASNSSDDPAIDIDLTKLSSTMIFSEVYNMMVSPEQYMGKTVKAEGSFQVFQDPDTKKNYYAIIIADATACCQQGLEFIWSGEHTYPDDYPESEREIEIKGVFQSYQEGDNVYYYLLVNEVNPV